MSVDVPEPGAAIEAGVKLAVTPAGMPLAERETAELKPPETAVVSVELPVAPVLTESDEGDAVMEKSGVCR